jgi:DNA-binding SARP family transcriptional activator
LQFRILGPLEVCAAGAPLPLAGASQRALLALLLLNANEVVSSDRLLDELWGEALPGSGATALQVRVSQLRKALGQAAVRLETRPPGYMLRVEPEELDLDRFSQLVEDADGAEPAVAAERLREALALWRGAALADFAYESFALAAIMRLDELRLAALERRIDADLALGRHAELVGELEGLVAEHPLREGLRGQLMLALYRSGRQAEALEAYRATRRALVEGLGLEPCPALQSIERAILRHDPELDLPGPPRRARSILVAALREESVGVLLELAEPLARRPPKELILARLVDDAKALATVTARLGQRREGLLAREIPTRIATFVSRTPAADIVRVAIEQDVDLLLVDGEPELLRDPIMALLLATAPCDVAVLVAGEACPGPVLVPFVGAEHDWAAIELAAWVAAARDVSLLLAGPRETPGRRDASRLLANASLAIQRTLGVPAMPLLLEPGSAALLTAADGAGLVVVGLSDRWERDGLGDVRGALSADARPPVVLVRHGLRPGGLAPAGKLTRFTWSLRS